MRFPTSRMNSKSTIVGIIVLLPCFTLIPAFAQRSHTNRIRPGPAGIPKVRFVDIAQQTGLTAKTEAGGEKAKRYIIETTGSGAAFIDFDNDGWQDVFLVNGSRLEGFPSDQEPTSHLYRNNRNGTFTDVTENAAVGLKGWGQGVCAGDYDNDGWTDLFVTFWG